MMVDRESQLIVDALGALAHQNRLALYRMLVVCGPDGLPAGVLAERLGVPPSSLTFHLQQLLHAELVTQRRVSRQLFYAADFSAMNRLVSYLTDNCCGQGGQFPSICILQAATNPTTSSISSKSPRDDNDPGRL